MTWWSIDLFVACALDQDVNLVFPKRLEGMDDVCRHLQAYLKAQHIYTILLISGTQVTLRARHSVCRLKEEVVVQTVYVNH